MLDTRRATFIVDLDHLQNIAQRFGKDAGEELAWFAAWRITEAIGADGLARNLGRGRYKVSLVRRFDEASVYRLTARVHEALRAGFVVRGNEVFISASIGIAMGSGATDALEQDAERAVRRVKANGGDATFLVRTAVQRLPLAAVAS